MATRAIDTLDIDGQPVTGFAAAITRAARGSGKTEINREMMDREYLFIPGNTVFSRDDLAKVVLPQRPIAADLLAEMGSYEPPKD